MPVTIKITKKLGPIWADDSDFAEMTDEQIIELAQEDLCELIDGSRWDVTRTKKAVQNG